ncbi:MAG: hypothetical protein QXL25_06480 [Candidatus Bathyarchaeia archaeon]|nr:hypothetical protein [Candidatus Bathyarchaeota archaeon]
MSTLVVTSFIFQTPSKFAIRSFTPSSLVYWSRFGLAVLTAFLCYILQLRGSNGLALAALIYLLSVIVFKNILRYGEVELQGKYKVTILGLGTYIFTWAAIWILLYTLNPY